MNLTPSAIHLRALLTAAFTLLAACATHPARPSAHGSLPSTPAGPDSFSPTRAVGPGSQPRLAVDAQRGRLHLVYIRGNDLLYRTGDLDGKFGEPESVLNAGGLWDPGVVVDDSGVPHVVVADGQQGNRHTWYTNRHGGAWRPAVVVFDKIADKTDRATTPHLFVAGREAIVGVFTAGGPERGPQWGMVARVVDLTSAPRVVAKRPVDAWNPQVFVLGDALWIGGRNAAKGGSRFTFQEHDLVTLAERGPPVPMHEGNHGEMARATLDRHGDLHVAGTLNRTPPESAGWYNTLARARAGSPALRFATTNKNASGAALPVPDAVVPNRVYVFHWSGARHDHGEPAACAPDNQLRFSRFEDGKKASEAQPVTDRGKSHGHSRRQTPGAVVDPRGGVLVVFEECETEPVLQFTRVGVPTP